MSLCQYRCCGYRQIFAVALYDSFVFDISVLNKFVSVYNDVFGYYAQIVESFVHTQYRGFQYVNIIYLFRIYACNCPCQGILFYDKTYILPLFFGKLLTII